MKRQQTPEGAVHYTSGRCSLALTRLGPRRVLARFDGWDDGAFGVAPQVDIEEMVPDARDLELVIDGRAVSGVTLEVGRQWGRWLAHRRDLLRRVVVVTEDGSPVEKMVEHVLRSEGLSQLLVISHDPAALAAS